MQIKYPENFVYHCIKDFMKLKTQTDESIIHVQEQTGEMQRHRQRLFLLVCSSDANQPIRSYSHNFPFTQG